MTPIGPMTRRTLRSDLDVVPIDADTLEAALEISGAGRVFGGQLAGQTVQAAMTTVGPDRTPNSLHTHFVRPAVAARPIRYHVERQHDGRSFSSRVVTGIQGKRTVLHASVTFHVPETGPDHQLCAPDARPPDEGISFGDWWEQSGQQASYRFMGDGVYALPIDIRVVSAEASPEDPERPIIAAWMRADSELPTGRGADAAMLAYATDVTLGVTGTLPGHGREPMALHQSASLDHSLWFHRPFSMQDWLCFVQQRTSMSSNRAMTEGRIFDRAGVLVATVTQECLVRYRANAASGSR